LTDPEQHNDDPHPVRKLLKRLPKVEASADFEQRLQRRIAEEGKKSAMPGRWKELLLPKRIPVFAYSLVTLVVVGVVSYYSIFRSGRMPRKEIPIVQENEKTISAPASESNRPSNVEGKADDRLKDSRVEQRGGNASGIIEKPANGNKLEPELRLNKERADGSEKYRDERDQEAKPSTQSVAIDKKEAAAEYREVEAPPVDLSREAHGVQSGVEIEKAAEPPAGTRARQSISFDSIQVQRRVAPSVREEAGKIFAPPDPEALKSAYFQKSAQQYFSAKQLDSIAQQDSLKADSLRRMQQQMQMKQQKVKARRPDGGR
jgi:hypothetical protein